MKLWLVWWSYGYSDTRDRLLVICKTEKEAQSLKLKWIDRLPQVWVNDYEIGKELITDIELEATNESW